MKVFDVELRLRFLTTESKGPGVCQTIPDPNSYHRITFTYPDSLTHSVREFVKVECKRTGEGVNLKS